MRRTALALLALLLSAASAPAQVTGRANVIDGDLLTINRQRFRIFGIDAIEPHQYCYVDGKAWACGAVAIRTLEVMVALEPATCRDAGGPADGQALWAECAVGGRDIGEAMVRAGFALANRAQTDKYVAAEEAAKSAASQIWKSAFVAPWVYRADLRAIEDRISARLLAAVQTDIERALTEGLGGVDIFQGFSIGRGGQAAVEREFSVNDLGKDFIAHAIPNDQAFNWLDPALKPIRWRQAVTGQTQGFAVRQIWGALAERPQRAVETQDALAFLTAMTEQAKPWLEAGRQPILIVRANSDPPWIGDWFGGEPIAGMKLGRKDTIRSDVYVGTVNGVDVYRGDLVEGEAVLFPADLLAEINYRPDAGGRLVAVEHRPGADAEPGTVLFRFSQGLTWKSDPVVVLRYPYRPPPPEYE